MLEHPVEALILATRPLRPNKVAVTIRRGRAISRKGSDARSQSHPLGDRLLSGRFHGWGRKLQRELPTESRLRDTLESFAVLQHLATRPRNPVAIQATPGMRNDATTTGRCVVLR